MPFLHVHRRRVPTQDVFRSVVVCMFSVAAILTGKSRLALTRFSVHGSAFRTGLRCMVCGHFTQMPTPFFQLLAE